MSLLIVAEAVCAKIREFSSRERRNDLDIGVFKERIASTAGRLVEEARPVSCHEGNNEIVDVVVV